jgi:hypothetical protein
MPKPLGPAAAKTQVAYSTTAASRRNTEHTFGFNPNFTDYYRSI